MKYFCKYIKNNNNLLNHKFFLFNFLNEHSTNTTNIKKMNSKCIYIQKYTITSNAKNTIERMHL